MRRDCVTIDQDLLTLGFELAYFIIADRSASLRVLISAMNKLSTQRTREEKRSYWRDKHLKRKITKIKRQQEDMLQWLIYLESYHYERLQEQTGASGPTEMLVHYIKHLVQISTAMSSFYVSVGFFRLLHNYSTSETEQIYERVTQHYPGTPEYRRIKGFLLKELQDRFAGLLRTCKGDRGELKFQPSEDQDRWAKCVNDCLRMFTPWSTRTSCAQSATDLQLSGAVDFPASGADWDHDATEMQRCHLFIEPVCKARIMKLVGLDPPQERLGVPMFLLNDNQDRDDFWTSRSKVPELTEEERNAVIAELNEQAARRQRIAPAFLTIVAHGKEYGRIDLGSVGRLRCRIAEGVKLIEIHGHCGSEHFILATHWVRYDECRGIAAVRGVLELGHRKRLHFVIQPDIDEAADHGAWLEFNLALHPLYAVWTKLLEALPKARRLPEFALASVLVFLAGWFFGHRYGHERPDSRLRSGQHQSPVQRKPGLPGPDLQAYRLIPDEFDVRGFAKNTNSVPILPEGGVLTLELVVPTSSNTPFRAVLKRFFGGEEIMTENHLNATGRAEGAVVRFRVPAALLKAREYYVVTLLGDTRTRHGQIYGSYTFYAKGSAPH